MAKFEDFINQDFFKYIYKKNPVYSEDCQTYEKFIRQVHRQGHKNFLNNYFSTWIIWEKGTEANQKKDESRRKKKVSKNANARIIDGADPEEEERNILEQQHFLLNEIDEREAQRQRQEEELDLEQPPTRFSRLAAILNDLVGLSTADRLFAINSGQRSPEILRGLKFRLLTSRISEDDIYYLRGLLERYPDFGDLIVPGVRRFL